MMFTRFLDKADKPRDHTLHECHVAPTFAGGALGVAEIVLHIDDNQYSVFWVDSLSKTECQSGFPIRRVFL